MQTILDGVNDLDNPDVATLTDGRSLVVATQFNTSDDVVFRFIDAAGAPGPAQDFIDNGAGNQDQVKVAAFGNNALVVYRDDTATPGEFDVQARFFNGTNFGSEVTIFDGPEDVFDPGRRGPHRRSLHRGLGGDQSDDIQARFVSATGVPLGSTFEISHGGGFDFLRQCRRAAGRRLYRHLEQRRWPCLRWRQRSRCRPALRCQRCSHWRSVRGQHRRSRKRAGRSLDWCEREWPSFHRLGGLDHTFPGADTEPDGIRGRAFVPTTDIVNGTEGDDVIQTYGLSEPINGLGGNDLINGLAGDDIIHGGAGFDQIKGGLGNDQLFGEGGEDLLNGEDGNDLLVGGLGRDVQIGGTGKDTFDFNKTKESRVGAKHDLIKGFSRAQNDKINLQTIDADTTTGGNQAFDFIGGAGFSGTAGELRLSGGLLLGDTNGNGIADFEIKVTGIGAGAGQRLRALGRLSDR